ncbi:YjbE family putative metal transport protein [Bacillus marinisedimentorum]|uniref:YjbE family putative metal transport protein n=1 Tax=Bacillus marinisedimentorum TaxID=1821260 RepID=UPI0008724FC1
MDLEFLTQVLVIIGIDIVLGGDNAIVIALASRNLPSEQRNKAIFLGTGLAVVIRIFLTIIAVYLLKIPFLQLVGGLFLIYIAYNLIVDEEEDPSNIKAGTTLGQAIRTIVFADIVMGFDNVIAVAGAAHGNILLVIFGLIVSVPIIIWGSKIFLIWMEKFPFLVYIGAGILAYTAGTMISHEKRLDPIFNTYDYLSWIVIVATILIVLGAGWLKNKSIEAR